MYLPTSALIANYRAHFLQWWHNSLLRFQCAVQAALVVAKTEKGVMTKALRKTEALLREMVAITLRTDLTRNQRTNLETCITIHMHQKVV